MTLRKIEFIAPTAKSDFKCSLVRYGNSRYMTVNLETNEGYLRVGRIFTDELDRLRFDFYGPGEPYSYIHHDHDSEMLKYEFMTWGPSGDRLYRVMLTPADLTFRYGDFQFTKKWPAEFSVEVVIALVISFINGSSVLSGHFENLMKKGVTPEFRMPGSPKNQDVVDFGFPTRPDLFQSKKDTDLLFGFKEKEPFNLANTFLWRDSVPFTYSLVCDPFVSVMTLQVKKDEKSVLIGKLTNTDDGLCCWSPIYQQQITAYAMNSLTSGRSIVIATPKRNGSTTSMAQMQVKPRRVPDDFKETLIQRGFTDAGVETLVTMIEEFLDMQDDLIEKITGINPPESPKNPFSSFNQYSGHTVNVAPLTRKEDTDMIHSTPSPIIEEPLSIDISKLSTPDLRCLTYEIENTLRVRRIGYVREAIVICQDTKIRSEYDRLLKELPIGRKIFIDDILDRLEVMLDIEAVDG